MTSIDTRIRTIISEQLGISEDEITDDSSFNEDLGADSLDMVELMMAIEEEFGLEIVDVETEQIETVKSLLEYMQRYVQ